MLVFLLKVINSTIKRMYYLFGITSLIKRFISLKMNDFLARATYIHTKLLDRRRNFDVPLIVVRGNESCDLDSAIGALVYGFALYNKAVQENRVVYVLPFLNVYEEDFQARTEVTYYLKKCGIDIRLVPTRNNDCYGPLRTTQSGILNVVLVDHHSLASHDSFLRRFVVEVIDHRPQDPEWLWNDIPKCTIENVGSCCSLIARKLNEMDPRFLTQEISRLLLGPIIMDTANFQESAGRTSPLDREMFLLLKSKVDFDEKNLYEELLRAKQDISRLSMSHVIRKDLKVVKGIPIIVAPILIMDLSEKRDFAPTMTSFSEVPVFILMGVNATKDSITRDMGLFVRDIYIGRELLTRLLNCKEPDFQLEAQKDIPLDVNHESLVIFKQGNVKATRKHVVPILSEVMSQFNNYIMYVYPRPWRPQYYRNRALNRTD